MPLAISPHSRRRLSAWLVCALLLVQWLVAAHACPVPGSPAHAAHGVMAGEQAAPCHELVSAGDEALCKAQCADEQQASPQSASPDVQARAAGWCMVMVVPSLAAEGSPPPSWAAVQSTARPGWPPLYIVHGALRN